jgi:hypothetical protein
VPRRGRAFLKMLTAIADALPAARGARLPGLHLEGPFVALAGGVASAKPPTGVGGGGLSGSCRLSRGSAAGAWR